MTIISHKVDGYDCEFEGLAWQSPEPDIGIEEDDEEDEE